VRLSFEPTRVSNVLEPQADNDSTNGIVQRLVLGLLDRDVAKRFTIKQALNSTWISNPSDLELLKQRYHKHVLEPFDITGHP